MGRTSGLRATTTLRVYTLTAAPPQGAPGGLVALNGMGFAAGQVVTLTLSLGSSTPLTLGLGGTDAMGALTPISLTIPLTAPAGQAAITAQDSAGEQVDLSIYGDASSGYIVGHDAADSSGALTAATASFVVPAIVHGAVVPAGRHQIYATGRSSHTAIYAAFDVQPQSVTLAPSGGQGGTLFSAGDTHSAFVWNGDSTHGIYAGGTVSDWSGNFNGNITVPAGYRPGPYTVAAYGAQSATLEEGAFDLTGSLVTLHSASGQAGGSLALDASGFEAGEEVQIYWDGDNIAGTQVATATVAGSGATGRP